MVNYTIIAVCALCFFVQMQEQPGQGSLVERLGMIPFRLTHPGEPFEMVTDVRRVMTPQGVQVVRDVRPAAPSAVPAAFTLLTCIFLHGGWMHFLGNMWFLYIFGDNVEDRFGHVGYLIFYLLAGVAASLSHLLSDPGSTIPTIGASGAIAGVMGAYFVWYPHARVQALIPIFFILQIAILPAPLFLGVWFLLQFFQGTLSTVSTASTGVAWWAHIGGFAIGAAVAWLLGNMGVLRPRNPIVRPDTDRTRVYRIRRHGNRL